MPWQWYKPNQGRRVRTAAMVGCALVALMAAYEVFDALSAYPMSSYAVYVKQAIQLGVPVVVLVLVLLGAMYVLNRPRLAEFLIETQAEMSKVSWPTRQQVMGSTAAVLVLVFIMAVVLLAMDVGWQWVLGRLQVW
jgi:preprotein translocase subunit SecE